MSTSASFSLALTLPSLLCLGVTLAAATGPPPPDAPLAALNPLLTESTLPFHYPPFDEIRTSTSRPPSSRAWRSTAGRSRRSPRARTSPPSRTPIVAMEKAGQLLARTNRVFFTSIGANTNPEMQKLQREMAPKLAAH